MSRWETALGDEAAFAAIKRAAESGAACPTNIELAAIAGKSDSAVPTILDRLANRGLISVERGRRNRVVTILETGARTAGTVGRPHWSTRGVKIAKAGTARAVAGLPAAESDRPDDANLPPAVHRDPCPRCGTRRDAGCGHRAGRIAVEMSL